MARLRAMGPDGQEVPAGATVRLQEILTAVKAELRRGGGPDARAQAAATHHDEETTPQWLAELLERTATGVRRELAAARTAADERVAQVRREADQVVDRVREEAEAAHADVQLELDEAVEDLQAAGVELEAARKTIAEHEAEAARLRGQHAAAVAELTAERERLLRAERAAADDRAVALRDLGVTRADLQGVRDQLRAEMEARRLAEQLASEHASAVNTAGATAGRLRAELEQERAARRVAEAELVTLRERIASEQALATVVAALARDGGSTTAGPSGATPRGRRVRPTGTAQPPRAVEPHRWAGASARKQARSGPRRESGSAPTLAETKESGAPEPPTAS